MASRFLATKAASFVTSPATCRRFATGSIDEHQLQEEMNKLISGDYSSPKNKLNRSVIKTFRFHEDGKWLLGSNVYLVDGGRDTENTDKMRLTGGIRYVVDKHGIILGIKVFQNMKDEKLANCGANWFNALPGED